MEIRQAVIPIGLKRSGKALVRFCGVTIHNTGNSDAGANASANAQYLMNTWGSNGVAAFHYVVDEKEAICTIPEDEIAEHSGKRAGNDTTTSIEICDNADGDILAATNNAACLAAGILLRHGETLAIWKKNIFQHYDWSGKDCPQDIRNCRPYGWITFVARVNSIMQESALLTKDTDNRPTFHITKALKFGMKDAVGVDEVTAIQRNLRTLGYYAGAVDGIFGPLTHAAVIAFQEAYKLKPDGIVGRVTTETLGGVWEQQ